MRDRGELIDEMNDLTDLNFQWENGIQLEVFLDIRDLLQELLEKKNAK